ncbi:hypothetical protein C8Q74DRAFT_1367938 [Fomes fomentarius]|nr:hypothetical protein C8Q74DRAFT_1367938 [Fomes fomentarius]
MTAAGVLLEALRERVPLFFREDLAGQVAEVDVFADTYQSAIHPWGRELLLVLLDVIVREQEDALACSCKADLVEHTRTELDDVEEQLVREAKNALVVWGKLFESFIYLRTDMWTHLGKGNGMVKERTTDCCLWK